MKKAEILNSLRVAAVADALGVPAEMKQRGQYQLLGMTGEGTWSQPMGSWSDDTSMTLCLIQNILERGSADDLLNKFERYMMFGEWTPRGVTFDVGRTCAHAVRQHAINHVPAVQCGDASEQANGNGALMRIAPLAFSLAKQPVDERIRQSIAMTTITHGHPRAVVGSVIYLEILHELLQGHALPAALKTVQARVLAVFSAEPVLAQELAAYQRLLTSGFGQLPVSAIKTSGYVVDTLEAAVWVALNYQDLQTGLLAAVNLGGDVDTIATVAGSLMSVAHPDQPVPADWWQATLNHKLLNKLMVPFAAKFGE